MIPVSSYSSSRSISRNTLCLLRHVIQTQQTSPSPTRPTSTSTPTRHLQQSRCLSIPTPFLLNQTQLNNNNNSTPTMNSLMGISPKLRTLLEKERAKKLGAQPQITVQTPTIPELVEQGCSTSFAESCVAFLKELDGPPPSRSKFDQVMTKITNATDLEMFMKTVMLKRRFYHFQTVPQSTSLLLGKMFELKEFGMAFDVLCDRPLWNLQPTSHDLMVLLDHVVATTDSMESLDQVYKTFALFIYYDMVPTTNVYDAIVLASVKEFAGKEGIRRAIVTLKEQLTLTIPVSLQSFEGVSKALSEAEKESVEELSGEWKKVLEGIVAFEKSSDEVKQAAQKALEGL